jgi:hypothetical protein
MVLSKMGQAQENRITKIFISSPKPKNNSATGITTGGGTGRSISMTTSNNRYSVGETPIKIPRGINNAAASM